MGFDPRILALALTGLATFAVELSIAEPGSSPLVGLAKTAGMLAIASAFAMRKEDTSKSPGISGIAALLGLSLAPIIYEGVRYLFSSEYAPIEIPLIVGLRNLGLGLAALRRWKSGAPLSAGVSLFLVVVATAIGEGPWTLGVAIGYATVGTCWLMLAYWSRLILSSNDDSDRKSPVVVVAAILLLVAGVGALGAVGPSRAIMAFSGFMPSSGGTDWSNPEALGGVNDGDNEVKGGEKPESVGFTESDVYLETDRPSLYDVSNDMYGEPIKRKKQDRMIALKPEQIEEQRQTPAENLRAGRQFAMTRQKPMRSGRKPSNRDAEALVYLKGPTPAHLPLRTYDQFDGEIWTDEPECALHCPMEAESSGSSWFHLIRLKPSFFAGEIAHQIKIGLLDSSPMPMPSHVERFKVGSVNTPEFFGWAQDGLVAMKGRTVPPGTVIEAVSSSVDSRILATLEFSRDMHYGASRHREVPPNLDPRVADLAASWTEGISRGWSQIDAVITKLRGHCHHDHDAIAPEGCDDIVAHFLFHARRGPDYHFASSASMLLRNLGYPTRLVSGFYASPDRYDAKTRHTTIAAEDVHVWLQVQTPGGTWIDVEPTPGYAVAQPPLAMLEWIAARLSAGWVWLKAHAIQTIAGMLILAIGVRLRREVADLVSTLFWFANMNAHPRTCVLQTLRLVERRASWAGQSRPIGRTPSRWYGEIVIGAPGEDRASLTQLITLADWANFSPENESVGNFAARREIAAACRFAVRRWTIGKFRDTKPLRESQ